MKKWITSAAILAAAFFAYAVHAANAAEGAGAEHGSWLLLTFFAINFILFVGVLVYFAGPPLRKFFADRAGHDSHRAVAREERAGRGRGSGQQGRGADGGARRRSSRSSPTSSKQETAFQVGKVADLAKSTAERIHRDTEMSKSALSEAAKRRVRAQLAESAANLARDLISRNFQPADQGRPDRRLHGQARQR